MAWHTERPNCTVIISTRLHQTHVLWYEFKHIIKRGDKVESSLHISVSLRIILVTTKVKIIACQRWSESSVTPCGKHKQFSEYVVIGTIILMVRYFIPNVLIFCRVPSSHLHNILLIVSFSQFDFTVCACVLCECFVRFLRVISFVFPPSVTVVGTGSTSADRYVAH